VCVFELTFAEKRDPRTLDVVRIRLSQLSAWAPAGKLLECAGVSLSVSFAADVANYRGFVWAVDDCTQPTHMHIDTVGLRNEFIVPYILIRVARVSNWPLRCSIYLSNWNSRGRRSIGRVPRFAVRSMRSSSSDLTRRTVTCGSTERKDQFPYYLDYRQQLFRRAADLPR